MFNNNFKEIRLQRGLTQKEVAAFLHISPQSISKWENGDATPSIEYLPLLARLFNCKIDDFFENEAENTASLAELEKFAGFCRIFEVEKDDPQYIDPVEYMKKNPGWENNCISFFETMKDDKCFTPQTLQSLQKCDYKTAQKTCNILEGIGYLTKAPDSKYYITNADNMGSFVTMIKMAKIFSNIKEIKNKSTDELDAWLDNEM